MKAGEIRGMDEASIITGVEARKKQLLEMRCQVVVGGDVKPAQIRTVKREIARMLTVLNEKKTVAAGDTK